VSQIYPGLLLQDRYQVIQQLGKGGLSQTFEVDDQGTRKVLKVLSLDRFHDLEGREKAVTLFKREAETLMRLRNPGIPRVAPDGYFVFAETNTEPLHCLVMEQIIGMNLEQWLANRGNQPMPQELAIAWLGQLSKILAQVHQERLIHRDIKPSNIMLRPNGQLALIDFGGVREITETYLRGMTGGTMLFSAGYTPWEQAEGKALQQSDFFALGRTFAHLLTGRSPVDLDKDPRTGKLIWHECAPHIAKTLAGLLDQLMATMPGNRPQTAQMILHALVEISVSTSPPPKVPIQPKPPTALPPTTPTEARKQEFLRTVVAVVRPSQALPNPWKKVEARRTFAEHTELVSSIAITPDSQILASGSYDSTIKLWSLQQRSSQHTLAGHTGRITCVAISPDGQFLVSSSHDSTIKLWSLRIGALLHTFKGHSSKVHYVAFSPNGLTLISCSSDETILWAMRTREPLRKLVSEQSEAIRSVAFSPDGYTCVIGSLDGSLELWNPNIGKFLAAFPSQSGGGTALTFSQDGQFLASSTGQFVTLRNPSTGQALRSFSTQSNSIKSIAFSPDGQVLAIGGNQGIELWESRTGNRLCTLAGHQGSIYSVGFSPDGSMMLSGSQDKTIKLWRPVP